MNYEEFEDRGMNRLEMGMLYDRVFETKKWGDLIPYLEFKTNWKVRITPPSVGATIRFLVRRDTSPKWHHVSVYLDAYSNLGSMEGRPYWEIYPYSKLESTKRFVLEDSSAMLEAIEEALDNLEELE